MKTRYEILSFVEIQNGHWAQISSFSTRGMMSWTSVTLDWRFLHALNAFAKKVFRRLPKLWILSPLLNRNRKMHLFEVDAFAAHIRAGDDADPILFISDVGGVWHERRYAHFLQRMPGKINSNNVTHLKLSKNKNLNQKTNHAKIPTHLLKIKTSKFQKWIPTILRISDYQKKKFKNKSHKNSNTSIEKRKIKVPKFYAKG